MNRIRTSPMVIRIVAFAIAAMMMLVIAFGSADMSDAKKKRGGFDCDAAQTNVGVVNAPGGFPWEHHYKKHKKPDFKKFLKHGKGNNTAAVCFNQGR